ncbi:MAG: GNAT family N-acetyltransferase [Planctomycetota bacterium]
MTTVREAREGDVAEVRDLFVRAYGEEYPFQDFYDTDWLKRAVFDDETLFLVAENDGRITATGSVLLATESMGDLVGEIGRLVAAPSKRAQGAAALLIRVLLERIQGRVHFAYGEVRTAHPGSQRLAEESGWTAAGFEPMKYRFSRRESVVLYASLLNPARELRRNNPRLIPEAARLAQTVLARMDLPVDAIIVDEPEGYPTGRAFALERLSERGVSTLLRIERGRLARREVFGHFSLAQGFFRIAAERSQYLVAREGDAVLGAAGFLHDPVDAKVRLFELIEFDDAVKGFLLSEVDRIAREELHAAYLEADVSAYSPRIQRTLERLGFVPVAYCPSMVFQNVERLDVLRMAKLTVPYDPGRMRLLEEGERVRAIVEAGLEDRTTGLAIGDSARRSELFEGLPEGELYHLSRLAVLRSYPAGKTLIREGDPPERLYILVEGRAEVRSQGKLLAELGPGKLFGEMGLVEKRACSADVALIADARVIEIGIPALERLMEARPRLGHVTALNLAKSLSRKLRGG